MVVSRGMLMMACAALKQYVSSKEYVKAFGTGKENFDPQEVADTVATHASVAAVSAMATGWLPGVAAIIASGIAVASIWSMYISICKCIGLKLKKDGLKALASAVATNIVTQLAGVFALELVFSFIPGANVVAVGLVNFVIVYIAGILFIKILINFFKKGIKPDDFSSKNNNDLVKETVKNEDLKKMFDEAKAEFGDRKSQLKKEAADKKKAQ